MGKINSFYNNSTYRYTLFGIAFGFCFPLAAVCFDVLVHYDLPFTIASIARVHIQNPILYMIDTAPFFLGLSFGIAGFYLQRSKRLNNTLVLQAENLENSNNRLQKALYDFQAAQKLLIKSEKLSSLGELTAGIAHELRNPLNFITNFSESGLSLLEELLADHDEKERNEIISILQSNLEKINNHGKRANNTLQNMMTLARSGKVDKRPSDINKLCGDATDMSFQGVRSTVIGFKCDLEKNFEPNLPKLNIIYEDISRVILNIITNAFYAVIKRREIEGDKYDAKVKITTVLTHNPFNEQEEFVQITILDNGIGIPAEIKEQIFNPFFTTKPSGEGTGLGLSISQDIVLLHEGEITVSSEENEFTEFKIKLPVKDKIKNFSPHSYSSEENK